MAFVKGLDRGETMLLPPWRRLEGGEKADGADEKRFADAGESAGAVPATGVAGAGADDVDVAVDAHVRGRLSGRAGMNIIFRPFEQVVVNEFGSQAGMLAGSGRT